MYAKTYFHPENNPLQASHTAIQVKYHPTFVSDATTDDVWYAIQKLAEVPSLAPAAARFRQNIEQQSFIVRVSTKTITHLYVVNSVRFLSYRYRRIRIGIRIFRFGKCQII